MRCLQQSETHLGEQNSRPNALNGRKTRLSFQIQSPNWCENRKGRVAKRTSERLNGSFSRFFNRGDFPKSLGNRRASLQRSDKTDFFLWPREMDPTNRHSHAAYHHRKMSALSSFPYR